MKRVFAFGSSIILVAGLLAVAAPALADTVGPIDFESPAYSLGNINGQNGWSKTGAYDVAVDSSLGVTGFGSQSLRISNAFADGAFGGQAFSPAVAAAGESGANNGTYGAATPVSHFESTFSIYAVPGSTGDSLSVSPDQGNGARMSYLRFENPGDGFIHVYFDDVQGTTNPANFVETTLPSLDASVPHTVKFSIDFSDGASNDVVNIYLDGTLVHTGTSWENYYRFDPESNPSLDPNFVPTVRTMLFRAGGTSVPANAGKGYLIDNLSLSSGPIPATVITNPADNISATGATLHGTDGSTAADNTSFWWGTGAYGSLTPMTDPSSEFPAGWSHDSGLGAVTAGNSFSNAITGLTSNTTYHFVAWVHIGGTWYPDSVLDFTTATAPTPTVTTNSATGETMTTATLNGTDGSTAADNTSFWWGTTAPSVPIVTPGADPASTGEFPAGWTHDSGLENVSAGGSFNEPLTGLTPGQTYYYVAWVQVGGVWYPGQVLTFIEPTAAASCPAGTTQAVSALTTLSVNSNASTAAVGPTLSAGQSYLVTASGTWQNSGINVADAAFASTNGWATYQEGYDTTPYFLGPQEFQLQLNGSFVNWGSYDGTNHTYSYLTTGTGAALNLGVFDGDSNTNAANAGWYGDNNGSLSVSVYPCNANPTTGSISGEKFNDKNRNGQQDPGEPGLKGWTIHLEDSHNHVLATAVTDANGNYSFPNLAPGTYKLREVHQNGWVRITKNPKPIVISAGSAVTDVDFGNAQIKKGEHQDNDQDDQRDDQQGDYYANHGHSDYGKDQNNNDHQHQDNGNNNQNNNHGNGH